MMDLRAHKQGWVERSDPGEMRGKLYKQGLGDEVDGPRTSGAVPWSK